MHSTEEKIGFSRRLKTAIQAAAPKARTASAIAIQFNLRHKKEPVSVQAVHKWLTAQAIPSSDKIETLAEWLGVTTGWLKYGYDVNVGNQPLSNTAHIMLTRFNELSERQQELVLELIGNLKHDKE